MTTLPTFTHRAYAVTPLDRRIDRELQRAIDERDRSRDRGDWVTKQACDMAIDVLMRLQRNRPVPP